MKIRQSQRRSASRRVAVRVVGNRSRSGQYDAIMNAAAKLSCCISLSFVCCTEANGAGVRHYVFFNGDRERISDAAFLGTKSLEGAQLKYTWRELERGKDGYDFSAIAHDLTFLASKGKKLFIQTTARAG